MRWKNWVRFSAPQGSCLTRASFSCRFSVLMDTVCAVKAGRPLQIGLDGARSSSGADARPYKNSAWQHPGHQRSLRSAFRGQITGQSSSTWTHRSRPPSIPAQKPRSPAVCMYAKTRRVLLGDCGLGADGGIGHRSSVLDSIARDAPIDPRPSVHKSQCGRTVCHGRKPDHGLSLHVRDQAERYSKSSRSQLPKVFQYF